MLIKSQLVAHKRRNDYADIMLMYLEMPSLVGNVSDDHVGHYQIYHYDVLILTHFPHYWSCAKGSTGNRVIMIFFANP